MDHARSVFDNMAGRRNVVSWTALLHGYVESGESGLALEAFDQMQDTEQGGCIVDARAYLAALSACASLGVRKSGSSGEWLEKGKAIHSQAIVSCSCNIFVENTLIDMYASCGSTIHARNVFNNMVERNVVSWNSMLQGYAESGENELVLQVFDDMEGECVPDPRTYVAELSACGNLGATEGVIRAKWLEKGKAIHSQAVKSRCCDNFVENAVMDIYVKCGNMVHARAVFDSMGDKDIVCWTTLMRGYVDNGESNLALELLDAIKEDGGCSLDAKAYVTGLTACASSAVQGKVWLEKGKALHSRAARSGCCGDIFVMNSLIDMYAKRGNSMVHAQAVFDNMSVARDTVSWSVLIMGYVEKGESKLALELIAHMDAEGTTMDSEAFVAALLACGNLLALEAGKTLHFEIQNHGLERDTMVATCLVDFYGRCGNLDAAKMVFDPIPEKTTVTWNTMLCAYSLQGDTSNVLKLFQHMKEQKMIPNEITFIHILSACSHAGLIDKAKNFFQAMQKKYGIRPDIKHYTCMVDLLSRGNHLDEALKMVATMPVQPDAAIWRAILSGSRKWNNVTVARIAYKNLVKLDEQDAGAYVLMANIYGAAREDSYS